jgi:hypothetical protein
MININIPLYLASMSHAYGDQSYRQFGQNGYYSPHHYHQYPNSNYTKQQYSQHKTQHPYAVNKHHPTPPLKSSSYSTGSLPYFHQLKQHQQQRHPSQEPNHHLPPSSKSANKKDVDNEWPYVDALDTTNGTDKTNGRSSDGTSSYSKSSDSPTTNSAVQSLKKHSTPSLSDLPPRNSIPPNYAPPKVPDDENEAEDAPPIPERPMKTLSIVSYFSANLFFSISVHKAKRR